jgi:hypothetical protein
MRIVDLEVPVRGIADFFQRQPVEECSFTLMKAIEVGGVFASREKGEIACLLYCPASPHPVENIPGHHDRRSDDCDQLIGIIPERVIGFIPES